MDGRAAERILLFLEKKTKKLLHIFFHKLKTKFNYQFQFFLIVFFSNEYPTENAL